MKMLLRISHILFSNEMEESIYKINSNLITYLLTWKSNLLYYNTQIHRVHIIRKIKIFQRRNIRVYGLKIIWQGNINSRNMFNSFCHQPQIQIVIHICISHHLVDELMDISLCVDLIH